MPRKFHKMPALPEAIDDPKVQELMSHYFATSNHDSDHEGFADMFTPDGEYSMNDRKAKGREEIINMRRGLWSHIPTRDHTPHMIYTHGHDQLQLMSRGDTKYKHHMGHETGTEWAAYYQLKKDENGEPKFRKIHIIAA
ncbi:MAG: hypothetical protein LQ344_002852 [Seirophora lacunosa]|nr:MAG: hypothetical protein LQ344_002852 [Seirophora lacunosa]